MGRNASFIPKKDAARNRWWISLPPRLSETGKRQKRFFRTKEEALAEAQRIKVRRENHGTAAKVLSPADEHQAVSALKLLRKAGCSTQLTVIVSEYLEALRQKAASKPLGEVWEAYLARGDRRISDVHRKNLETTKRRLLPLHAKLVSEISAADLEDCLREAAPTYRNSLLREIKAVFNWCMGGSRKWVVRNPVEECEFAAVKKTPEVRIYTPNQIKKLLAIAVEKHPDLIPAIAVMTFAGVRPDHLHGEIVRLEWSHVICDDGNHNRIELPGSITKTGKRRSLKIRPALMSWIEWHLQRGGGSSGLVCPVKGQPLRRKLREVFEHAQLDRIQDGLRHSFASYLAPVEGLDAVETELGHLGGREVLNRHYRTDVRRTVAEKFWGLRAPNLAKQPG